MAIDGIVSVVSTKNAIREHIIRNEARLARLSRHCVIVIFTALCFVVLAIVLVLTFAIYDKAHSHDGPQVDLNYTKYAGAQLPNGVNRFLGMRYAAAPLGDLRWRAPIQPERTGTLESALEYKPICFGTSVRQPYAGQGEDCLFANVWTPANATAASKLPVWTLIQGGGYIANANPTWDGAEVVERSGYSVVMVTFNYRVGLWGFLASEKIRKDGNLNTGLLDQRRLLFWIKEHISQFGGDPDHVVIHGSSAGAGSVALHLTAFGGRDDGLFVGGMAESLFIPAHPATVDLEWQFEKVTQLVGCDIAEADDQMSCLRHKDVDALQAANTPFAFPGRTPFPPPSFYWTPCIDGDLIQELPYLMFQNGKFIDVPVLFGNDNDEGTLFAFDAASQADMQVFFKNNYPTLTDADSVSVLAQYPQQPPVPKHQPWFSTLSWAYGEAAFICPTVNVLSSMAKHFHNNVSSAIFSYRFNVLDDENTADGLGVPHLFDAAAIFGPQSIPGARASYNTYNAPVVPVFMSYWISFVRALDPNIHRVEEAPRWEQWDGGTLTNSTTSRRLLIETGKTTMENITAEEVQRCKFWEALGSSTEQKRRF